MERISTFFSWAMHREAEHPSSKKFWVLINKYSHDLSLVFVLKFISTFIGQNKEFFFMHVLKKDVLLLFA